MAKIMGHRSACRLLQHHTVSFSVMYEARQRAGKSWETLVSAFLGLSIWFTLVTVIPGLVTIAVIWGAILVVAEPQPNGLPISGVADSTLALAVAVSVMLLTQSTGVLLEEKVLVPHRWLGHRGGPSKRTLKSGVDPVAGAADETEWCMDPYEEYMGLYVLLAELREGDDVHGHLERAVTQFFLTVNTLVSFASGIVATLLLAAFHGTPHLTTRAIVFSLALVVALAVTWGVAVSRFELMGWSVAAARRRRARDFQQGSG